MFPLNEVKLETLTNGELKQAITIVFGGWAKSDLHKRVRLFAPKSNNRFNANPKVEASLCG
ncbi:MAG: hypothetical protein ACTS53_00340 [Candidatus Hodgkinia cicadicola]